MCLAMHIVHEQYTQLIPHSVLFALTIFMFQPEKGCLNPTLFRYIPYNFCNIEGKKLLDTYTVPDYPSPWETRGL
jgi:hypothetical protein